IYGTQAGEGAESTTDSVTVTVVEDDDPDVEPVSIAATEGGAEVPPSGVAVECSGDPGGAVTLDVDGTEVGSAEVGDEGNWSAEKVGRESCGDTVSATEAVEGAESTTDAVTVTGGVDAGAAVEPVRIAAAEDCDEVPRS